jgi:hypothetical protein
MTFYTEDQAPRPLSGRRLRRAERRWQAGTSHAHRVRMLDGRVTVYPVRFRLWPPARWQPWQGEPTDETVSLWPRAVRGWTEAGCERRAVREYERRAST